jgi:hypothetical protein
MGNTSAYVVSARRMRVQPAKMVRSIKDPAGAMQADVLARRRQGYAMRGARCQVQFSVSECRGSAPKKDEKGDVEFDNPI